MLLNYNFIKLSVEFVTLDKNIRFILYHNPTCKSHIHRKTIAEPFSFSKYARLLPISAPLHMLLFIYKTIIWHSFLRHLYTMTSPER